MNHSEFIVDIPMCVYNHEKYIAQAIEGIISQKTQFNYRLIIGEDCSTDNSRQIITEYVQKYPNKIIAFFNKKNIGVSENSKMLFNYCSAKYIALCDGDDYWTNSSKLQKQIDFLDNNKGFAVCFHNAEILYEDEPERMSFSNYEGQKEISEFEDIAQGEFIYTPTCVFRKADFDKLPHKYYKYLNNYTIDLHNAQYGKLKYIDEVMSVYRVHKGGIWSMVSREKTLINQLPTYRFYLHYFDKKYKKYFLNHLKNMTSELVSIKLERNDFKGFLKYYKDYFFYNFRNRNGIKNASYIFLKAGGKMLKNMFKSNE